MNNINRDNDVINDYFISIIKQSLEKKYYLIFFIIITLAIGIYQYYYNITYQSEYIIKRNEKIETSISKNLNSLNRTNNQFDILNKIVSTQRMNDETRDLFQFESRESSSKEDESSLINNLLMLGSLLSLDLASGPTKKFLEFVSIVNRNNLTVINLDIENKDIFSELLNKISTDVEIHNLINSDYTYQFNIGRMDTKNSTVTKNSFGRLKIESIKLLNHKELVDKELSNINNSILSQMKNDIKVQIESRIIDFHDIIKQAKDFMIFYKTRYRDNANVISNQSTQEFYTNQVIELAEVELKNLNKFDKLLSDIEIYELINTSYQVVYRGDKIKIFILPLIVFIIFMALIILSNSYNSYYSHLKKNN